jgi:lysozyme family protein
MRENFNLALGFVLRHEGGYVNDAADPGGETKFGISKRAHPDVDIKSLIERDAADIYLRDYWLPTCDILAWPKDVIFFDTAVNMGVKKAMEILSSTQTWEEMLFRRVRVYTDIVIYRPGSMKFFRGWLSRVLDLWRLIREENRAPEQKTKADAVVG